MDNQKDISYYLSCIISDINFIIEQLDGLDLKQFSNNQILCDSVCFRFIQISENAKKIKNKDTNNMFKIPYFKLFGLRNRIVHNYQGIDFEIIYLTAKQDLPLLMKDLEKY